MGQEERENGFFCSECGKKNPYPRNVKESVIRGDYPVVQSSDQQPRPRKYMIICRFCGQSNEVFLSRSTD
jgi:hypothetical protein